MVRSKQIGLFMAKKIPSNCTCYDQSVSYSWGLYAATRATRVAIIIRLSHLLKKREEKKGVRETNVVYQAGAARSSLGFERRNNCNSAGIEMLTRHLCLKSIMATSLTNDSHGGAVVVHRSL